MSVKQERMQRLMPDGKPRYVRVYDNKGETFDRYTVIYTGHYPKGEGHRKAYLTVGLSHNPSSPQGFCIHDAYPYILDAPDNKRPPKVGAKNHLGIRIKFDDLPKDCQSVVTDDYEKIWGLV